MLMDRIIKETTDQSRVIIDMTPYLDTAEALTLVSATVSLGATGWSEAPYPPPGAPPPYDPTPLILEGAVLDTSATTIVVFVRYGTPGNVYTVQIIVDGTSGRRQTLEIGVQVTGIPPVRVSPVPLPTQGAQALPIQGGTLQGPLYLFEDPFYPTEASTKAYVDAQVNPLLRRIDELERRLLMESTDGA